MKVRLHWLRVGPGPVTGALPRRGKFGHREREWKVKTHRRKPRFVALCFGSPRKLMKGVTVALFVAAKEGKQAKYPLVGTALKLWSIHSVSQHAATEKAEKISSVHCQVKNASCGTSSMVG